MSKSNAGDPANDDTDDVALSANGRFVGFESYATNLPGSIGPTYQQVYLRDRKRNKTTLVSRTNSGDPAAGDSSDKASVSANGKLVQFESYATNFPGGGT